MAVTEDQFDLGAHVEAGTPLVKLFDAPDQVTSPTARPRQRSHSSPIAPATGVALFGPAGPSIPRRPSAIRCWSASLRRPKR
ncbi:hypothetical protein [Bradyrhizobium sp. RDM12]